MKRKLLAIVLALTMLLSLFTVVPASAEDSTSATTATLTAEDAVIGKITASDGTETDLTLAGLRTLDKCAGSTVTLTSDVVVDTWTTISEFSGDFDGAGHTITGITAPLFYKITDTNNKSRTFKNLTVEGNISFTDASAGSDTSLIVGMLSQYGSTIVGCTNVVVKGSITVNGTKVVRAGGFYGQTNRVEMDNCKNYANITVSTTNTTSLLGGFTGSSQYTIVFKNCENHGNISDTNVSSNRDGSKAGGLVGLTSDITTIKKNADGTETSTTTASNITVTNCINTGDIFACSKVGGLIADMRHKMTMTNCKNTGSIKADGKAETYIGGICGFTKYDITMTSCINTGDVIANLSDNKAVYLGGMVGISNIGNTLKFEYCANYGNLRDDTVYTATHRKNSIVGGLIGRPNTAGKTVKVTKCLNAGNAYGQTYVGGFFGVMKANVTIEDSVNTGNVTSASPSDVTALSDLHDCFAAGFVAMIDSSTVLPTFERCINTGEITSNTLSGNIYSNVGGFVGYTNRPVRISNSKNSGTIKGNYTVGGIAGHIGLAGALTGSNGIFNCISTGDIQLIDANATKTSVSGILASLGSNTGGQNITFNFENNYYIPTTDSMQVLGGARDLTGYMNNSNGLIFKLTYGSESTETCITGSTYADFISAIRASATEKASKADITAINKALGVGSVGVQLKSDSTAGTFDFRYVIGLDSLEYSKVGFELMRYEENGTLSKVITASSNTVYTSLLGYDTDGSEKTYQPSEFNCTYLSAITVSGIPSDITVTFVVRPYVLSVDGTTTTYGAPSLVTFVNGVMQ